MLSSAIIKNSITFSGQGVEKNQHMPEEIHSLLTIFKGWDGYQISLVQAIAPLSREQLAYRPAPHLRTAGELARHICQGRFNWFQRTFGVDDTDPAIMVASWPGVDAIEEQSTELVRGLEATWQMIENALRRWTVDDLTQTYQLSYQGKNYALPRQWILWRIMAHDLHHGGELAFTLGMQNIAIPELGDEGGHITEPPLAEPS
jgi:uncharacterized damage-inducible protein DinB